MIDRRYVPTLSKFWGLVSLKKINHSKLLYFTFCGDTSKFPHFLIFRALLREILLFRTPLLIFKTKVQKFCIFKTRQETRTCQDVSKRPYLTVYPRLLNYVMTSKNATFEQDRKN